VKYKMVWSDELHNLLVKLGAIEWNIAFNDGTRITYYIKESLEIEDNG